MSDDSSVSTEAAQQPEAGSAEETNAPTGPSSDVEPRPYGTRTLHEAETPPDSDSILTNG